MTTLVNYIAASEYCVVYHIKITELEELGKKHIALQDRLSLVKARIMNRLVGDIDYFPFPRKFMEQQDINISPITRDQERQMLYRAKKLMI